MNPKEITEPPVVPNTLNTSEGFESVEEMNDWQDEPHTEQNF